MRERKERALDQPRRVINTIVEGFVGGEAIASGEKGTYDKFGLSIRSPDIEYPTCHP